MATGKSCSRWFAPIAALLMVVSLSGCFDKEGDQRKAFIDFLQNTVMRSGERLPKLRFLTNIQVPLENVINN